MVEEHSTFRTRARAWLTQNAPLRSAGTSRVADEYEPASVATAKSFQRRLHEAGFSGLTWPVDVGGQGLDPRYEVVFQQESSDYDLPNSLFNVGLGMCGPTILAHGDPAQRDRWAGAILRGEDVWCQLFSEPDAGSDLAAVRTRAHRSEGGWLVNGQKIWTSYGRFSDFGLALVRCDPTVPKHRGLMVVVVDMRAPGVQIRPLRQMTGMSKFDQVYLDDVFVPNDCVIGAPGEGWQVTRTTLSNERVAVGGNTALRGGTVELVVADARKSGVIDDPVLRQRIADAWAAEAVIMLMRERVRRALLDGRAPGPEGALAKLASSRFVRQVSALGLAATETEALAWEDGDEAGEQWAARVCAAPGLAVGGGTDEIVASIVAERMLGLPREPKLASRSRSTGYGGPDPGPPPRDAKANGSATTEPTSRQPATPDSAVTGPAVTR